MQQLTLSDITLAFGGPDRNRAAVPVLHRVSLTLERGAFVSIIGRSGSGKTSLLNIAAGFIPPTSGRVILDGRAVDGPGPERAVVFQDDALYPWLTAGENVAFPLRIARRPPEERQARARELLAAVGLEAEANRRIWELSGGQRQRVGLARALAAQPALLLMDEPLGALDAMTRDAMHGLLLRLWQVDRPGVLLITHSVEEALFLSTAVVVLAPQPGRIVLHESFVFGQRFLAGAPARSIKSEPAFIAARERLVAAIHYHEAA
jgi:taurine transport system ATP-binding protein